MSWLFGKKDKQGDKPDDGAKGASAASADAAPPKVRLKSISIEQESAHGIPPHPSCMAYDPVQKILGVGTRRGAIKLYGQPGAEETWWHDEPIWIDQLFFVINKGTIISSCPPKKLHIWDFAKQPPELAHALELKFESISAVHLPVGSNWIHVGTEKGNILFFSCENFVRSSMDIMWNKAAVGNLATHPGGVSFMNSHPQDSAKLLIGYEKGLLLLWDVMTKGVLVQFDTSPASVPKCMTWLPDNSMFKTGHDDGKVECWSIKSPTALESKDEDTFEFCEPVTNISAYQNSGTTMLVHDGGPTPLQPATHLVTVEKNGQQTRLPFTSRIIAHVCLDSDPWQQSVPSTVAVLLDDHLEFFDLRKDGIPRLPAPYGLELQMSRTTCSMVVDDCPQRLSIALRRIAALIADPATPNGGAWPITGGRPTQRSSRMTKLLLTGHHDGAVRFWDMAAPLGLELILTVTPPSMCKQAAGKIVHHLQFCPLGRTLCVAHEGGLVLVYNFSDSAKTVEPQVVEAVLEIAIAVAATDPDATSSSKEQLQFMNQALKMGFTQEQFGAALAEVAGDGAAALGALLESSVAQIGDSATEARKPSMVLKDGMNLGGESEDTDPSSPDDSAPPAAPDATYHAPPGFQLTMVCSCFVGADQNREQVEHVSSLRLCTGWSSFVFSNRFGVCLVDYETAITRTFSLSQFEALRSVKFSGTAYVQGGYSLKPSEDAVTEVAFGPALYKGKDYCQPSVWVGTAGGHVYTFPIEQPTNLEMPVAAEPVLLRSPKTVVSLNFSEDGGSTVWKSPEKNYTREVAKSTPVLPTATMFHIKTAHGKFVVAKGNEADGNNQDAGPQCAFHFEDKGGGKVSLKCHTGKYLCMESSGRVICDRGAAGGWETFQFESKGGNRFALRSAHGKYLCCESNGQLIANRDSAGDWETFERHPAGTTGTESGGEPASEPVQKLEPESAPTAESVGGIDGGQAYTQLLASVKAAPNKAALEALVQAIKISMEAKDISDNETVRLRTAYTERAAEINAQATSKPEEAPKTANTSKSERPPRPVNPPTTRPPADAKVSPSASAPSVPVAADSSDVQREPSKRIFVWITTMKSTSLWECPSGSRKQRSPALSTSIYKASAATCQGAAVLLCLTDDGLLSVLTAGNLEVISQEKVVQKADRTGLRTFSAGHRGTVVAGSQNSGLHSFKATIKGAATSGEPEPGRPFPLFVAEQEMPAKLVAAKRPSVFSLFSSKKNAAEVTSAKARDELLGRRVDDRETTAYSKRVTGAAGVNPEWSRLREKMDQRKERLAQQEEASARMAENGQQFGDAAADLANYYKNKKWYEF